MNIDEALEKFLDYKKNYETYKEKDLSETDTRCKLLDKMLIDILGWKETDINREGSLNPGYYDYKISTPSFQFIIEAKKNLIDFNLSNNEQIKLKTLYNSNQEAVEQIRKYIEKCNLAFGILTNGHQFIIAKFINNNGVDWKENKCHIFNTLEKIEENFIDFYKLISKEAVLENSLLRIIDEIPKGKILINCEKVKNKNENMVRNEINEHLAPILRNYFRELYKLSDLTDKVLLEKCYVDNEDLRKQYKQINTIFEDNPPDEDIRVKPVRDTKSQRDQLKMSIENARKKISDPIVLIGSRGAGKTTFINNLIYNFLTNDFKRNNPIIYIDIIINYQKNQDLEVLFSIILNKLYDEYENLNLTKRNILEKIYQKEIKWNKEGIWANLENNLDLLSQKISDFLEDKTKDHKNHLKSIIDYLKNVCNKSFCIILDNADTLDEGIQKDIYQFAYLLYKNYNSIVIVSLREGYFYKWRSHPPFDQQYTIIYHISAPIIKEVIKKRLQYVIENFDFDSLYSEIGNKTFKFSPESVKRIFENLFYTLFNTDSNEVVDFICSSYPNVRVALSRIESFFLSYHTRFQEYMSHEYYKIPIWEFIQSIALDNHLYYNEKSIIHNLFIPAKNDSNHFTKIYILNYLYILKKSVNNNEIFIEIEKIIEYFNTLGFSDKIIIEDIITLYEFGLIETQSKISDISKSNIIDDENGIQINQQGSYYLNDLICRFHYLDLAVQNTPIFDELLYNKMVEIFPTYDSIKKRNLSQRKELIKNFITYLLKCEERTLQSIYNFDDKINFNIKSSILDSGLNDDFDRIEKIIFSE